MQQKASTIIHSPILQPGEQECTGVTVAAEVYSIHRPGLWRHLGQPYNTGL